MQFLNKRKKNIVIINGQRIFWDHEKEIFKELNKEFNIFLFIIYREGNNSCAIEDIVDYCTESGINIEKLNYSNRRARSFTRIIYDLITVVKILMIKPDLIYMESFGSPYLAIYSSIFFNKKKTIFAIHDYKLHPYRKDKYKLSEKFYQFIYLKFYKNFHLFSSEQADMMREDHPKKNIFYIKLFLIKNDFQALNHSKKRNSDKIIFLFFGKIHYYKGVDILINAGNILSQYRKNFKITIAGNCSDFSEYESLIKNKKYFDLKIRFLSKEEISELFKDADYIILPYREVTQSGPLMIAYNFGIVPIVSDLNGFKELVSDNDIGFLFKTGSSDELAKKMNYILNLNSDGRRRVRNNLIEHVAVEYDVIKFAKAYNKMFEKIINSA